jgi:hypothetical protein
MDFLQRVGAEISLTTQLLHIGRHSLPLRGQVSGVSTVSVWPKRGRKDQPALARRNMRMSFWEDWEGTVELAEAVTVPPLSVRIARCRVIRRGDSEVVKVLRNQEVLVDPEGLRGVYLAWLVATLESGDIMSVL